MLKIAQIQFSPILGDINGNTLKVENLLSQCTDSDLIILPELSDTGYNFPNKAFAKKVSKPIGNNKFIELLMRYCVINNNSIITGFCENNENKLFNSSALIDSSGIRGIYQKIHLFMNEKDIFNEGETELLVYDIGEYKIGMQICFDYLFPEPWNILAQKGAQIIAHPSNLVTYNAFKVIPALSVINKVFIPTTNRIGCDGDLRFAGKTFLSDNNGELLNTASSNTEEILFTNIDPTQSNNKMITSRNHVFKDRRPRKYK